MPRKSLSSLFFGAFPPPVANCPAKPRAMVLRVFSTGQAVAGKGQDMLMKLIGFLTKNIACRSRKSRTFAPAK